MKKLSTMFLERIGLKATDAVTFEGLGQILQQAAMTIPFENLSLFGNSPGSASITEKRLQDKILVHNQGGLCYELNALLYFFLVENGFNVTLTRGVVFNQERGEFLTLGRTHVLVLLAHEGETYLLDTGFGGNLPLLPVPLSGETVHSRNGSFRVKKTENSTFPGDHILEMKLAHIPDNWRTGYAFYANQPLEAIAELDEIQEIIAVHPESSFNKQRLITRLTETGNITLTDTTITRRDQGVVTKKSISPEQFPELLEQYFGVTNK